MRTYSPFCRSAPRPGAGLGHRRYRGPRLKAFARARRNRVRPRPSLASTAACSRTSASRRADVKDAFSSPFWEDPTAMLRSGRWSAASAALLKRPAQSAKRGREGFHHARSQSALASGSLTTYGRALSRPSIRRDNPLLRTVLAPAGPLRRALNFL